MKVLRIQPKKYPEIIEIDGSLESLQKEVAGPIQAVYPWDDPVALICNEEGKLTGLPLNRALRDEDGEIYDIVAGNFFLVGLGADGFTDLAPEHAAKFAEQFKHPEEFARLAGKIIAIKQPLPEEKAPQKSHGGPEL